MGIRAAKTFLQAKQESDMRQRIPISLFSCEHPPCRVEASLRSGVWYAADACVSELNLSSQIKCVPAGAQRGVWVIAVSLDFFVCAVCVA